MNNTFFKAQQWAFSYIKDDPQLDQSGIELLLRGQMNWSMTDLLLHLRDEMSSGEWETFQKNVEYYKEGWPVQYILGYAEFFGLKFKVTPDTLIPRVETEELVEWILNDLKQYSNLKVLDVGTGSGAIGLSLKSQIPTWQVTLSDISAEALAVARENAKNLKLNVQFIQSDLFKKIDEKYDVLVSNPPYISFDESKYMDKSVLEHEPKTALFAADHGLALYKRIAQECSQNLSENGKIYLEIGFKQGQEVQAIFQQQFPDANVTLKKDMAGNDRMIKVSRNEKK